jgi:hypothetical protein
MAQSVWIAIPSQHQYKIVDMTGKPTDRAASAEALGHAPNGEGAIVVAVAIAAHQGRRVTSLCKFNMEIVIVVD